MLKKAKEILRNESGMSIIIVLSIGAFFVALSAAVLYAASLQTSSANRVLPQENAYRMAYSFVENVVEPDLKAPPMPDDAYPLKSFVQNSFLDSLGGYNNGKDYIFTADNEEENAGGTITITMRKMPTEDAEQPDGEITLDFDDTTTQEEVAIFNDSAYNDYVIAMTVKTEIGGESYALSKHYHCYARYALNGNTYRYKGSGNFEEVGFPDSTATLENMKSGSATGYYIWLPEGGEG